MSNIILRSHGGQADGDIALNNNGTAEQHESGGSTAAVAVTATGAGTFLDAPSTTISPTVTSDGGTYQAPSQSIDQYDTSDTSLAIGSFFPFGSSDPQYDELYHGGWFLNTLGIPQGAFIVSAVLNLTVGAQSGGYPTTLRAYMEDADDATEPTSATQYNSKTKTTAYASAPVSALGAWGVDFSDALQEVVNRPGWAANNSAFIMLVADWEASGDAFIQVRSLEYATSGEWPTITVEYISETPTEQHESGGSTAGVGVAASGGGGGTATIVKQIAAGNDDGIWYDTGYAAASTVLITGDFDATSLNFGSWMRFANCALPPGAVVTSAVLTLIGQAKSGAGTDTVLRLEDSDNPSHPTTRADALARPRTSSVSWNPSSSWSSGPAFDSPDLSAIVQEVVDRPGWASGNALQLFWEDPNPSYSGGNNRLQARAYEDAPGDAAILTIDYIAPFSTQDESGGSTATVTVNPEGAGTFVDNAPSGSLSNPMLAVGTQQAPNRLVTGVHEVFATPTWVGYEGGERPAWVYWTPHPDQDGLALRFGFIDEVDQGDTKMQVFTGPADPANVTATTGSIGNLVAVGSNDDFEGSGELYGEVLYHSASAVTVTIDATKTYYFALGSYLDEGYVVDGVFLFPVAEAPTGQHESGGSTAGVAVDAEGAGTAVESASGGSTASITVDAQAGGTFTDLFLVIAVQDGGDVDLTWAAQTGATGYAIERDGQVIAWDVQTAAYTDLTPSQGEHTYRVGVIV